MSNEPQEATDTPKPTLEDLNYFWAIDGLPVFYADRHDIEDVVEDLGFSIYYLICNIAEDKEVKNTTYNYNYSNPSYGSYNNYNSHANPVTTTTYITEKSTAIVRVVNNIIGRSVSQVENEEIADLAAVRETAEYNLPGIPIEIVNRLDDFFRLVDAQHGTESIVMLTFDPTKNDSSGWGVLVPEQSNTSVHCNYNPDSIVEEKPDHVMIVGSVHSHPGMAAYASGTDHADQADFDGIHITYGWQKSVNGGATQYYIEMQMAGKSWTLKPEDVFEGYISNKDPDSVVVEWSTKVKKVLPPQGGSASQGAYNRSQTTNRSDLTLSQQVTLGSIPVGTTKERNHSLQSLPQINDKEPHIIVAELDPNAKDIVCPSCDYSMSDYDLISGECPICDIPVVSMTDNYRDVITKVEKYIRYRELPGRRTIYLWTCEENGKQEVMRLSEYKVYSDETETGAKIVEEYAPYAATDDDDDDDYNHISSDGFDPDKTVCCYRSPENCTCPKTVLFDDVTDFEIDHKDTDVYDPQSNCLQCRHQFTGNCPAYYEAVIDYATTGRKTEGQISECNFYEQLDIDTSHMGIYY